MLCNDRKAINYFTVLYFDSLRGTIVNDAAAAALAKGLCMNHSLRILMYAINPVYV